MVSDCDLVLANFNMKMEVRRCPKSIRIRFDLDKLNDPEIVELLHTQIGEQFAVLDLIVHEKDIIANDIKEG